MEDNLAQDFIESFYEDVIEAMSEADNDANNIQYRLGVRKLAWAFFNKFEIFEIERILSRLTKHEVDAWFSQRA